MMNSPIKSRLQAEALHRHAQRLLSAVPEQEHDFVARRVHVFRAAVERPELADVLRRIALSKSPMTLGFLRKL